MNARKISYTEDEIVTMYQESVHLLKSLLQQEPKDIDIKVLKRIERELNSLAILSRESHVSEQTREKIIVTKTAFKDWTLAISVQRGGFTSYILKISNRLGLIAGHLKNQRKK